MQESRGLVEKLRDAAEGPQHKWWALAAVSVGVFMSTLDISIVNISLPRIMDDLNADLSAIQWVVLAYLLTISSLLLTFGRLADLMGRKRVYIAGFVVFTVGNLLAEAEYRTSDFLRHRHDIGRCDLIVVWEHDLPYMPVPVLELKTGETHRPRRGRPPRSPSC